MIYRILIGDVIDRIREIPDNSIHCVVTSPPYWGLRDYGTGSWSGGDTLCRHIDKSYGKGRGDGRYFSGGRPRELDGGRPIMGDICPCGAVRTDSQIGLERTPEEYTARMVEVFREVRRVLRPDGTCWINIGDSYASDTKWGGSTGGKHAKGLHGDPAISRARRTSGLKAKDLIGIPWRVAFALQEDGWWLRQDIIWSKPNPMPESVTDRCTKAHEYIFLLTKSARYFYDAEAIKEAAEYPEGSGNQHAYEVPGQRAGDNANLGGSLHKIGARSTRNKRSVWEIATEAFPEAHFATFPSRLVEPCILAGSPISGSVLDPFSGSGTTGIVALGLGREYIGIELNPEYAAISERRIAEIISQPKIFSTSEMAIAIGDHQMGMFEE